MVCLDVNSVPYLVSISRTQSGLDSDAMCMCTSSAASRDSMPLTMPLQLLPLLLASAALFTGAAHATRCACAKTNLHLRTGPGLSYDVVGTLTSQDCLPHDGQEWTGSDYQWRRLDFQGQKVWAAVNWLIVRECSAGDISTYNNNDTTTTTTTTTNTVQLPGCPRIITRAEWSARAPTQPIGHMPSVPVYVFIHHGAGGFCHDRLSCTHKVQSYQNYHMDGHGWWDIGYNFVVGEDGNAYEARGWDEIGAHTKGYNSVGIAISIIGDFSNRVPNTAALTTVRELIQCGLNNSKIHSDYTLKGHRDVGNTLCPGDQLYHLINGWPHYAPGTDLYTPNTIIG